MSVSETGIEDTEAETYVCTFHQSPISQDELGPEDNPIRTPCGEPICLDCWMDINGLGSIDTGSEYRVQ